MTGVFPVTLPPTGCSDRVHCFLGVTTYGGDTFFGLLGCPIRDLLLHHRLPYSGLIVTPSAGLSLSADF